MAEVLLKRDQTGVGAMAYKPGDPVIIKDDGAAWGTEELNPLKFLRVIITGVTAADLQQYLAPLTDPILIEEGQPKRIAQRRYFVDRTKLPGNLRNQLESTGSLTFTWTQVRAYLYDKATGVSV